MKIFNDVDSSRRAFFRVGTVALAAITPTVAGATTGVRTGKEEEARLRQKLVEMENREAIIDLQSTYHNLLEQGAFHDIPDLFTVDAKIVIGDCSYEDEALGRFFREGYVKQKEEMMHTAYRHDPTKAKASVQFDGEGMTAHAKLHLRVEVSKPYRSESTLEAMAMQQGLYASSHWVNADFSMHYRKENGRWKISRLEFV